MAEIKSIIDDIAIAAFEGATGVAGIAVISNAGNLVFQTENFDVSNQINTLLNVMKGENSYLSNNLKFSVTERSAEGIIATNNAGMGHVILVPFQGGILVAYVMHQSNPSKALGFLKQNVLKLDGKV